MIDYKTSDILDIYKNEYYNQKGSPLQIGSDDFAAASVHSYVLGVLISAFNHEAKNRFIETATGAALDGIAATFGLERPDGEQATVRVEFAYNEFLYHNEYHTASYIPAGDVVIKIDGKEFYNKYDLTVDDGETVQTQQTLYAREPGTAYNDIPTTAECEIEQGEYWIESVTMKSPTGGGTDGFPHTEAGDNAFREWLTTEIQALAGAGTYLAYEARAKNADPRVLDVHVLRQNEIGYVKGNVKIYILERGHDSYTAANIYANVLAACDDPKFRPIGDKVTVAAAGYSYLSIGSGDPGEIQVTYPRRFIGLCNERTQRIINEYRLELRGKIGIPFSFAEICTRLCTKDDDGVYATDAKPLALSRSDYLAPVYPASGNVLALTLSYKIDLEDE